MQIEVGKKYVMNNQPRVLYVEITGAIFHADHTEFLGLIYRAEGYTAPRSFRSDGTIIWDIPVPQCTLIGEYCSGLSRTCSLGCDLVDSGMKWTFCRACETQYEFKNWEWIAMRKAK